MSKFILAHDLGTSGNKATLYSLDGKLYASCVKEYATYYPAESCVEQKPSAWWEAVCEATKQLINQSKSCAADIACVSFSGQMMGCLLVDKQGIPLRDMIIWADTRSQKQADIMERLLGMDFVYHTTGHRISASYSAAKLMWIKENEPEVYSMAYKMLNAKDYLVFKLTGRFVTDYSDASGTNLFDIKKKKWSESIVSELGIDKDILPELHASNDIIGGVTKNASIECGLMEGTPVVIGGGDGSCACVGAGVVKEGKAYNVLGSSSWISFATKEPFFDEKMRTFNWVHLNPQLYTPCGTMQSAGFSFSWYKNTFCKEEAQKAEQGKISVYKVIEESMNNTKVGSGGLLFLPYLLGERSPRWNVDARGAFVGLSINTSKAEVARSILEGVGFNLKLILDILNQKNSIKEVIMIGGGSRINLWLQIIADIWQKELVVPQYLEEATSIGAAVCGGVAIKAFNNFEEVNRFNKVERVISPNQDNQREYEKLYKIFNKSYEALTDTYKCLAEYRKNKGEKENG